MHAEDFVIEALVDFPDDVLIAEAPITAENIDAMMQRLAACGVRRVSWAVYGDGHGGFLVPDYEGYHRVAETYRKLDGNPLKTAVQAARRHGLEIHAYFKPYETGAAGLLPAGSPEAMAYGRLTQLGGQVVWLDPFVAEHPELRIRRRTDDLPAGLQEKPIRRLTLRKRNDAPTRITRDHLQIWASEHNFRYRRLDIPFTVTETVEPAAEDIPDLFRDEWIARKGDAQRVLTLDGLDIHDRYILVTTDFQEGLADFENTDMDMLSAFDADGREIPGVFASGSTIWFPDKINFREWGLMFDHGYGGRLMRLDDPNHDGRKGIVAFTRGRNAYLPGALCETEPRVQTFWLSCIQEMLASGVDGVDFREENHSTHTDYPEDYGYNEVILERCRRRGSLAPQTIAAVRGEAYTAFLEQAGRLIRGQGRAMRIHFQVDWYRPCPPRHRRLAYPGNLDFQWRDWIDKRLTDEAVLRFFVLSLDDVLNDAVAHAVIERCRHTDIPIVLNRYLAHVRPGEAAAERARIRRDGRFHGLVLYETANFLRCTPDGGCEITNPEFAPHPSS